MRSDSPAPADRPAEGRSHTESGNELFSRYEEQGSSLKKINGGYHMKRIILLIGIVLLALFSAGCTRDDTGTAATENQPAIPPTGKELTTNVPGDQAPPSGVMNETPGSLEPGSMPPGPGMQLNLTDGRPTPQDGINMTPGSLPQGQAPPDRPDMNQTGIPRQGNTGT